VPAISKIKLKIFKELGVRGTDSLHLSQDGNLWQTIVNMVMKLAVP